MILVSGRNESIAGSTAHLGPGKPGVLVMVGEGDDLRKTVISPSRARLLAKSLMDDADTAEPTATLYDQALVPTVPDEDE